RGRPRRRSTWRAWPGCTRWWRSARSWRTTGPWPASPNWSASPRATTSRSSASPTSPPCAGHRQSATRPAWQTTAPRGPPPARVRRTGASGGATPTQPHGGTKAPRYAAGLRRDTMRTIEGMLTGRGLRIGMVVARFNEFVTSKLMEGALDALVRHEVDPDAIDVLWVPGSFEIPLAAKRMADSGRYDAVVCLGAVIRGATPHFDYVASEVAKG